MLYSGLSSLPRVFENYGVGIESYLYLYVVDPRFFSTRSIFHQLKLKYRHNFEIFEIIFYRFARAAGRRRYDHRLR